MKGGEKASCRRPGGNRRPTASTPGRHRSRAGRARPRARRFASAFRPNSMSRVFSGCRARSNWPFPKCMQEAFRVPPVLEPDDHIIGVAHDDRVAFCPFGPPLAMEPEVKDIVQIYIRQHGRGCRPLRRSLRGVLPPAIDHDAGFQPLDDQPDHPPVPDPILKEPDQPVPRDGIEERADVAVDHPVDFPPVDGDGERIMRPAPRSEPVAVAEENRLVYWRQDDLRHRLLDDLVLQCGDAERSCSAVRLGYLYPSDRRCPVRPRLHATVKVEQALVQPLRIQRPCHAVHARRSVPLQRVEGAARQVCETRAEGRPDCASWPHKLSGHESRCAIGI